MGEDIGELGLGLLAPDHHHLRVAGLRNISGHAGGEFLDEIEAFTHHGQTDDETLAQPVGRIAAARDVVRVSAGLVPLALPDLTEMDLSAPAKNAA